MNIKFVAGSQKISDFVESPKTSKSLIPKWYKNIVGDKDLENIKKCMPFFDAISHGYIQTTWANIYVKNNNGIAEVTCDGNIPLFLQRENTDMPVDNNFYNIEFVWQRPWSISLPENFSCLITHPLNRIDLPFTTLSGIVDSDKSIHAPIGNIPFFIKNGFSGLIPKGTPMFQIIPIKRENWESETKPYDSKFWSSKIIEKISIKEFYKKKIWQKKLFN
jgi:hypothetical protein